MNRNIQTIFCDDIRHEIDGKISYIGAYNGVLFVSNFPATLPKLCLSVIALTPSGKPFTKLKMRVLHNDAEMFTGELDENQLSEITGSISANGSEDAWLSLQSFVVFSPFTIEAPGKIRVLVETEEGELLGPGLKIDTMPVT
jgi:hypothetical protein